MQNTFNRQCDVINRYLASISQEKSTTINWVNVQDGTFARLVIGLRNWKLFVLFLIATFTISLASLCLLKFHFREELGWVLMCLWPITFVATLYYARNMIPPDQVDEEYRGCCLRVVRDMFKFLRVFGHWPENIKQHEVEHALVARLDKIDRRWPEGMVDPRWRDACYRLEFVRRFFPSLKPIRPSTLKSFGQTVRSV